MTDTKIEYPIRINKYLLQKGYCSRREADRLIEQKKIKINGKVALVGQKINEGDKVEIGKEVEKSIQDKVYLAFNKPKGIVTHDPQEGERGVMDIIHYPKKVFLIGRLDKESHGLIILTDDGRITHPMLSPEANHEKEYVVEVNHRLDLEMIKRLERGVKIQGQRTKPAKVKKIDSRTFHLTITEGKKHQIRRMCAAVGLEVLDLQRVRIMNIKLGNLKLGQYREIKGAELKELLSELGIK